MVRATYTYQCMLVSLLDIVVRRPQDSVIMGCMAVQEHSCELSDVLGNELCRGTRNAGCCIASVVHSLNAVHCVMHRLYVTGGAADACVQALQDSRLCTGIAHQPAIVPG